MGETEPELRNGTEASSDDDFETVVRKRHSNAKSQKFRNGGIDFGGRGRERERDFRNSRPYRRRPFRDRDSRERDFKSSDKSSGISTEEDTESFHHDLPGEEGAKSELIITPAPPPVVNPWHVNNKMKDKEKEKDMEKEKETDKGKEKETTKVITNGPTKTATSTTDPRASHNHNYPPLAPTTPPPVGNPWQVVTKHSHSSSASSRKSWSGSDSTPKKNNEFVHHDTKAKPKHAFSNKETKVITNGPANGMRTVQTNHNHDDAPLIITPAPPPVVNPWHVNKNAVSVITKNIVLDVESTPTPKKDEEILPAQNETKVKPKTPVNNKATKTTNGPTNEGVRANNNTYPSRGRGRSNGRRPGRGRSNGQYWGYKEVSTDEQIVNASPPQEHREGVQDFPADYTTLPPLYPMTEFIMPYSNEAFFPTNITPTPQSTVVNDAQLVAGFVPVDASVLLEMMKKQIEYYFCEENLEKDFYLRRKMDNDGFLPVNIIATFPRVKVLSQDLELVIESIQASQELELTEDCLYVRTRNDPYKWPITSNGIITSCASTVIPSPSLAAAYTNGYVSLSDDSQSSSTASSIAEKLNPNVPEFIPRSLTV